MAVNKEEALLNQVELDMEQHRAHARSIIMNTSMLAKAAYSVVRAYAEAIGDDSISTWSEAGNGRNVALHLTSEYIKHPSITAEGMHQNWLHAKLKQGWGYGAEFSLAKKEHPSCKRWGELSEEQRVKDVLFRQVVLSIRYPYAEIE